MALAPTDRELIEDRIGRNLTQAEAALFENLWSEHCAYRSSRSLLRSFDSTGEQVVVGPGDDAAVISVTDEWYLTFGIESHNHPSYVDPYDGAATGVGGIVRDTLSMGAYPIALADSLYFGDFSRNHSQYLLEGVVEGIADYGNAIGVPTVAGSVRFHPKYEGNPLVNVACVGLVHADRLVTATAKNPGNKLVLVGNATGRDGLGGASFASEDLAADAETADRPAVQVGDPYTEKLLIEANEALLDADLIEAARDLGAAGLGGASSEMVAKGNLGAEITLESVHQREPNMNAMEILLAESQERMCYEVMPDNITAVKAIADRYEVGCSVIGTVTDSSRYRCTFDGETVVDVPAAFLSEGAPLHDLPTESPKSKSDQPPAYDPETAVESVLSDPNTASKEWIYRQYDHEVGVRTVIRPGDDAAILSLPETNHGLALTAGAEPNWTERDPYRGAQAVALEAATNLASKGALPHAAVDCLNGGNPETPSVYHGFSSIVAGLGDMCKTLNVPVVGGNVSLYNDSPTGPIPPTPTIAMIGLATDHRSPTAASKGTGDLVLVGDLTQQLGGSVLLSQYEGEDAFPKLPDTIESRIETIATVSNQSSTLATHDIGIGGLVVTLAEMVTPDTGIEIDIDASSASLFAELPGRVVFETSDTDAVIAAFDGIAQTRIIGQADQSGKLSINSPDMSVSYTYGEITDLRSTIDETLE